MDQLQYQLKNKLKMKDIIEKDLVNMRTASSSVTVSPDSSYMKGMGTSISLRMTQRRSELEDARRKVLVEIEAIQVQRSEFAAEIGVAIHVPKAHADTPWHRH
mmetsp:Transcript_26806/g.39407  ORF Transcript_26806/g.39407 Transcript_26806/m.39407 type:complete len:103 (+) Transcript_26806:2-310(+)